MNSKIRSSYQLIAMVLVLGIIGLAQQILAGRILTPEFGNSVYTWGSIIGVFMTALSLGYHFGGKFSQYVNERILHICVLIVSMSCIIQGFYGTSIVSFFGAFALAPQYGVLLAVTFLFGPSVFVIGMFSPFAIELSTETKKGKASGKIFTIDTIGSIIGAFGATFVLIPLISVSHSFFFLAILGLVVLGFVSRHKLGVLLTIALVIFLFMLSSTDSYRGDGVYFNQDSTYQNVEVFDSEGVRFLYLDNHPQSAMFLSDITEDAFPYSWYFDVPFLFTNISQALFVGAGGFTGPRDFSSLGITVTAVELDPVVVDVGKKFFLVNDTMMNIVVSDGREYLRNTDTKYDVIILDAFRKDKIPFHLATQEFYQLVYDSLAEDGVMYTNIIGYVEGRNSDFFRTSLKTISSVFLNTYAFAVNPENPLANQNIQIIATKSGPLLSKDELLKLNDERTMVNVSRLIPSLYENVPLEDVIILTDEYAPVDELILVE